MIISDHIISESYQENQPLAWVETTFDLSQGLGPLSKTLHQI